MIRSFKDRETAKVAAGRFSKKLPTSIQARAFSKLDDLEQADSLSDLAVAPGNRLEALKGHRKGQHSIRISQQWRVCFRWDGGAHDVEIVDYH